MREIIAVKGKPLAIGYEGENEAVRLCFPIAVEWRKLYGNGTFTILMQRPTEDTAYPKVTFVDGNNVFCIIDSADVSILGMGAVIVRYHVGGTIAKSEIYSTRIRGSIGAEGETPEPYQAWVDEVLSASENVDDAVERAESARDEAVSAKEASADNRSITAQLADIARLSASGAEQYADDAEQSADSAEASAVRAERAAESVTPTDVRINGQSITESGVADIPYATTTVPGLISVPTWGGMLIGENNSIYVGRADNGIINNRLSGSTAYYRSLTPIVLDYAVKAAMADGKGPAWTEAEQLAARQRMGIDEFELIEEFRLTDAVVSVERTNEPNGTPYNFKSLCIICDADELTDTPTGNINGWVRMNHRKTSGEWIYSGSVTITSPSKTSSLFLHHRRPDGLIENKAMHYQNANIGNTNTLQMVPSTMFNKTPIESFLLYSVITTNPMPKGLKIRIYGRRA